MVLNLTQRDDVNIIHSIAKNCKINYMRVSRETGYNYLSLKRKIDKLISNGFIEVKPLVSTAMIGREAALVKFKSKHSSRLVEFLARCNRFLAVLNTNDTVTAIIIGRSKTDILKFLDNLSQFGDGISEYNVEFGSVPLSLKIPIKSTGECRYQCFIGENTFSCLQLNFNNKLNNRSKPL